MVGLRSLKPAETLSGIETGAEPDRRQRDRRLKPAETLSGIETICLICHSCQENKPQTG